MAPSTKLVSSASSPGVTEDTPLLHSIEGSNADVCEHDAWKGAAQADPGKPLPKRQIFLLCFARMMEPIAFFSIFPFIAQMVQRNGQLPESDVGFYSGLIESLFSVTQVVVLIFWGRLADRIGRKPVLLCSLAGLTVGPVLFCMATTIPQMILFRCLAGMFSGSDLIIRTMVTENSTPATQARAFSWFSVGGNLGLFLGPVVGGTLANPATQYPSLFGGIEFFERHPFALPGFAAGGISLMGAIAVAFFLEETLPEDEAPQSNSHRAPAAPSHMSMRDIVRASNVPLVLFLYGHVMLLGFAFTAIFPVLLYTPVRLGGLGFGPSLISLIMSAEAASQALWMLLAFPVLQRRIGTKGILWGCGVVYPLTFAGYIGLNYLRRDGSDVATVWFWIACSIESSLGPGVAMSFTAAQLALNSVAPSPHVLGTLNAIALTVSSAIRAIAPGATSALYAVGVRDRILDGHLIWAVLVPLATLLGVAARWLPEEKEQRRDAESE